MQVDFVIVFWVKHLGTVFDDEGILQCPKDVAATGLDSYFVAFLQDGFFFFLIVHIQKDGSHLPLEDIKDLFFLLVIVAPPEEASFDLK